MSELASSGRPADEQRDGLVGVEDAEAEAAVAAGAVGEACEAGEPGSTDAAADANDADGAGDAAASADGAHAGDALDGDGEAQEGAEAAGAEPGGVDAAELVAAEPAGQEGGDEDAEDENGTEQKDAEDDEEEDEDEDEEDEEDEDELWRKSPIELNHLWMPPPARYESADPSPLRADDGSAPHTPAMYTDTRGGAALMAIQGSLLRPMMVRGGVGGGGGLDEYDPMSPMSDNSPFPSAGGTPVVGRRQGTLQQQQAVDVDDDTQDAQGPLGRLDFELASPYSDRDRTPSPTPPPLSEPAVVDADATIIMPSTSMAGEEVPRGAIGPTVEATSSSPSKLPNVNITHHSDEATTEEDERGSGAQGQQTNQDQEQDEPHTPTSQSSRTDSVGLLPDSRRMIEDMLAFVGKGCDFLREAVALLDQQQLAQLPTPPLAVTPPQSPMHRQPSDRSLRDRNSVMLPASPVFHTVPSEGWRCPLLVRWQAKADHGTFQSIAMTPLDAAPPVAMRHHMRHNSLESSVGSEAGTTVTAHELTSIDWPASDTAGALAARPGDVVLNVTYPPTTTVGQELLGARREDRYVLHMTHNSSVSGLDALQRLFRLDEVYASFQTELDKYPHDVVLVRKPDETRPKGTVDQKFVYSNSLNDTNDGDQNAPAEPTTPAARLADTTYRVVATLVKHASEILTHDELRTVSFDMLQQTFNVAVLPLQADYVLAMVVPEALCRRQRLLAQVSQLRDVLSLLYGSPSHLVLSASPAAVSELRQQMRLWFLGLAAESSLWHDPEQVAFQPQYSRGHSTAALPGGVQVTLPSHVAMELTEAALTMGYQGGNMQLQRSEAAVAYGSCFVHRGLLVHSSLPPHIMQRVMLLLRHLGLLDCSATLTQGRTRAVLCHPIYGVARRSQQDRAHRLLTVVEGRSIFCALLVDWQKTPASNAAATSQWDTMHVVQAELVMDILRHNDILARLDQAVMEPVLPLLSRLPEAASSSQVYVHSNSTGNLQETLAGSSGSRDSGTGASRSVPLAGSAPSEPVTVSSPPPGLAPADRRSSLNQLRRPRPPQRFGGSNTGSPLGHHQPPLSSSTSLLDPLGAERWSLSTGRQNVLLHYLAFDAGRGLLLSSECQESHAARGPLQQQVLLNFHRAVLHLRRLLMDHRHKGSNSSSNILGGGRARTTSSSSVSTTTDGSASKSSSAGPTFVSIAKKQVMHELGLLIEVPVSATDVPAAPVAESKPSLAASTRRRLHHLTTKSHHPHHHKAHRGNHGAGAQSEPQASHGGASGSGGEAPAAPAAPPVMNPALAAASAAVSQHRRKKKMVAGSSSSIGSLGSIGSAESRTSSWSEPPTHKLRYWVQARVGRAKTFGRLDEFYVCYQDGVPQNIVEMSFRLLAGM